ncbi:MAG: alpha-amylase [Clostridiales bacterium]|nr:alpha-amylase [Clostridiales bacterium]
MKKLLCLAFTLLLLLGGSFAIAQAEATNWYEVFVYSYSDSDGNGIGDFPGLLSKLDYIHDMGYDGIWLMPVMPSPSYHKYDVTDYKAVDPLYGTMADFKAVVARCQELGIRLIIDLPVNHSSTRHPWFLEAVDALKIGRKDHPKVGYYNFRQEEDKGFVQLSGTDWYYEEQFAGGQMPDLNLDNPALREEIRGILAFWLIDVGIDGFRLDAVTSFYTARDQDNIAFLRFMKETCQELKPDSYLVGECWKSLEQIAAYYDSGIDSFFLFPAAQAEGYIAASIRSRKPAETFVKYLNQVKAAMPDRTLAPFLSNHDTGRTVGLVQGRQLPQRVKFAHALLSLMGGHSFTYYGEEIGMLGSGNDPNKRLGMLWAEDEVTKDPPGVTAREYPYPGVYAQQEDPASILNYIKKMNHQRLKMPLIALGKTEVLQVTEDVFVLKKSLEGDSLYIAVNCSSKEQREISLEGDLVLKDVLDAGDAASTASKAGSSITLLLQPYGIGFLSP